MLDPDRATILVGVDFTQASEAAVDRAIEMARKRHAQLRLVHALKPLGAPGLEPSNPSPLKYNNETAEVDETGHAPTDTWLRRIRAKGVHADAIVRAGSPAAVILEEADRISAAAVVVGSHRRTPFGKALLGSVSEEVARRCPVEVEVVPGPSGHAGAA
ncbi:MAG: hypothetical protein QOD77_578 [Thermoplasmata archaeon]|jgi:nucleotide-binding universal stress UspA family protein|nr:hypothetical protein [Thermoplasmata archaeon]